MASIYDHLSEADLRTLRSWKVLRLKKLSSAVRGWLAEQEMRKLTTQLEKIDAELRRWEASERLF
jgi:hypothetical protein